MKDSKSCPQRNCPRAALLLAPKTEPEHRHPVGWGERAVVLRRGGLEGPGEVSAACSPKHLSILGRTLAGGPVKVSELALPFCLPSGRVSEAEKIVQD